MRLFLLLHCSDSWSHSCEWYDRAVWYCRVCLDTLLTLTVFKGKSVLLSDVKYIHFRHIAWILFYTVILSDRKRHEQLLIFLHTSLYSNTISCSLQGPALTNNKQYNVTEIIYLYNRNIVHRNFVNIHLIFISYKSSMCLAYVQMISKHTHWFVKCLYISMRERHEDHKCKKQWFTCYS